MIIMLGFRKSPAHDSGASRKEHTYRYRVDSRKSLVERFDLVALRPDRDDVDEQHKLARVLEEISGDGWRLVGISGDDFVFRRRGRS
jgi:hypothetical protein